MKPRIRSILTTLERASYNRYRAHLRRRRPLPAGLPAPAYTHTPSPWRRKAATTMAVVGGAAALFAGGHELSEARVEHELEARQEQAFDRYMTILADYGPARAAELKERGLLEEGNDDPFAYIRVASVNPPQAPELVRLEAEVERSANELDALAVRVNQLND